MAQAHLAIDANSHEIVAVDLTTDDVGDITAVPDLLDQIDGPVASVTADGAYDADVVHDEFSQRHPGAAVIIPPRSTAVVSESGTTRRDEHLRTIEKHGRIGWQRRSGAQAIADGAWLKRQCSAIGPSLGTASTPALCPIKRRRRESEVRPSIG